MVAISVLSEQTSVPASQPLAPAERPPRYIRRVKGGKWQARPYRSDTAERHNLGLFKTLEEAQEAIEAFLDGHRDPLPKFVHRHQFSDGSKSYWAAVPSAGKGGKRTLARIGEWFSTPEEASRAVRRHLELFYGRQIAAMFLSRRDTSRKAQKGKKK